MQDKVAGGWARRAALCTALLALHLASPPVATAAPLNDRPVAPQDNGHEPTLQNLIDTLTLTPGEIDAINDQSAVALWENDSEVAVSTLLFEIAGHRDINEFGIYSATDSEVRAIVFGDTASPVLQRSIQFHENGSVEIDGTTTPGFGDGFGFFIHNTESGELFFSEDSLNEGLPHTLVYQGDGSTVLTLPGSEPSVFGVDQWLLAFEDLPGGGDLDYQDLVVHVSHVSAKTTVPEPGTAGLVGFGILALGMVRRRRRR